MGYWSRPEEVPVTEVSIIIPTYNRAKYLRQAIDSALEQELPDLELVVVDDGSTDNTRDLVAAYSDARLHYVYQENQGATAAFNTGVGCSRGDYISILGSDDWYLPGGLLPLLERARADPDAGVVAAGYLEVDDAGRLLREARPWKQYPRLTLETWLFWCPVLFQSALIRRDWITRIGGIRTRLQDWDLGLRLARSGCRMTWVEHFAFAYRLHAGQFIREAALVRQEWLNILDRFFQDPDLPRDIRALENDAYVHAYLKASLRAFEAGDGQAGCSDLEQAIRLDPRLEVESGGRIYDMLVTWATGSLTANPHAFLDTAFRHMPPSAEAVRKRKREAAAAVAMSACFEAHAAGDQRRALRMLLRGVWLRPTWLKNRGALSIGIQSVVGDRLAGTCRRIGRSFVRLESDAAHR
jgi:glycosyltransferase involved in cell wall biosynthesis